MTTTTREVTVTTEKVIKVTINNDYLTEEFLQGFTETMFEVDAPEDLFAHAAEQIARHAACDFVEGLGEVGTGKQYALTYRVLDEQITTEVMDQ
jgi:hypothetical protein